MTYIKAEWTVIGAQWVVVRYATVVLGVGTVVLGVGTFNGPHLIVGFITGNGTMTYGNELLMRGFHSLLSRFMWPYYMP